MTIRIRRLVMMYVRTLDCPPYHLILKKTIWITNRRSYFYARRAGTSHYKLQVFNLQRNSAMPLLSLHALHFQIPAIQLGQRHHHCSNANSQPSSTNYQSLTVQHPPRCCCYSSLVETRMFHNPGLVLIRMFLITKRLPLR